MTSYGDHLFHFRRNHKVQGSARKREGKTPQSRIQIPDGEFNPDCDLANGLPTQLVRSALQSSLIFADFAGTR